MQNINKTFKTASSSLLRSAFQIKTLVVSQARLSSKITPIKMSAEIFETNATDKNLPPLIIMHGLLGSRRNWRNMSNDLTSSTKRKVHCVDARNHGDSPHNPEHSLEHLAEDILYYMQEEKIKTAAVVGHSMGGRAMMCLALKYPHVVEKAVFVDISPASVPNTIESMKDLFLALKNIKVPSNLSLEKARPIVKKQVMEHVDEGFANFILMNLKKLDSGEFAWKTNFDALYVSFNDFRDTSQLRKTPYEGPVLFICGDESDFFNPDDWSVARTIFPKAELKWLNCGHLVHYEKPAEFRDLVTNFLRT